MKIKVFLVILTLAVILSPGAGAFDNVNLAVMNFYSDNSGTGQSFSETLSCKLNKLDNLNVIDRESQKPVLLEMGIRPDQEFNFSSGQALGQTIGADYILCGNLKEETDNLKVKFQLYDVNTDAVVLEDSITGKKEDIFKLQGDLGVKLASYFNTSLTGEIKEGLYFMPTQNMASFEKFSTGLQLYEENRIDEAYNFFLGSIEGDTSFLDAHKYFEYAAKKGGKLQEFIKTYENMLAKDHQNPILMNYLGNGYLDIGNMEKAGELYKNAIKIDSTFPNPHNNLATVYALNGHFEEALKEFETALKYSDRKATVYYNIGLCYMNMKNKEKAETYFKKALEIEPANPDFVVARGVLYGVKIMVEHREKAVPGAIFGEILVNSEPVFEIQTAAGGLTAVERAEIIAKRLQVMIIDGLEPYEIEIGKVNNQVVIGTSKGAIILTVTDEAAKREGMTPESMAEHKGKILKEALNTASSNIHTEGGFVLQPTCFKVTQDTINKLEIKIDTEPLKDILDSKFTSQNIMKEELKALGYNPDEILVIMEFILKEDEIKEIKGSSEEGDYLHRGDAYYSSGNMECASDAYKKALEINPSFAPAQFCLGLVYMENKDYKTSETYLSDAVKNDPQYTDAYIWLGKVYLEQGKTAEANSVFLKALELDPDNEKVKEFMN